MTTPAPTTRLRPRPRPRSPWLRVVLATLAVAMLLGPSCTPGFDAPSKVNTLRILAVTADHAYAQPGQDVTLAMTLFDGYCASLDPEDSADAANIDAACGGGTDPRNMELLWVGGCTNPEGDQYFLCFEQLLKALSGLGDAAPPDGGAGGAGGGMGSGGGQPTDEGVCQSELPPGLCVPIGSDAQLCRTSTTNNGEPDAHTFTFTVPDDIVTERRPPTDGSPYYGIEYVFFAACAGKLAVAPLTSTGGEVPDFPLQCCTERDGQCGCEGAALGSPSFVIGYTQVYAFDDGRLNGTPPIAALEVKDASGAVIEDGQAIRACPVSENERRVASCGNPNPTESCTTYTVNAVIEPGGLEADPNALDSEGNPFLEATWVSYFSDGGDMSPSLALVQDAVQGYIPDHETSWIPPATPGTVSLWAVLRDQRGGSSVVRRTFEVEAN